MCVGFGLNEGSHNGKILRDHQLKSKKRETCIEAISGQSSHRVITEAYLMNGVQASNTSSMLGYMEPVGDKRMSLVDTHDLSVSVQAVLSLGEDLRLGVRKLWNSLYIHALFLLCAKPMDVLLQSDFLHDDLAGHSREAAISCTQLVSSAPCKSKARCSIVSYKCT